MRLFAVLSLSLVAFGSVSCGDSTPEPVTPDPNNPCPPGQFCPQPTPVPTATATTPTPTATATGGQATPIAAAMATPVITGIAQGEVQGMQPEGGAFAGQFTEGQTLEQPININPGKCYAVVGVGLPGVVELDVQIALQPLPTLPPTVVAQDNQSGAQAILGGKGSCFKNPTPIAAPGKVILKVTKGQGIAGAQVYVK
jgi:hypothetical protein